MTVDAVATGATALAKAAVLVEALPWLERFHGARRRGQVRRQRDDRRRRCRRAFAEDVVFLRYAGLRPVVVHGGGPQITAQLDRLGIATEFRGGLRVTTPEAMDVVRMVLVGQVQREIVGLVNAHGPFAVGLSGEDARPVHRRAARRSMVDGERGRPRPGRRRRRGRPRRSCRRCSTTAGSRSSPPSPAAPDGAGLQRQRRHRRRRARGRARRREARRAHRRRGPVRRLAPTAAGEVVSEITAAELRRCCPTLSAGMVPKMEACLRAVRGGVPQAHVLDGRVPHALLLEVFTDEGVGTMVLPDDRADERSLTAADASGRWDAVMMPNYGDAAGRARPRRGLPGLGRRRREYLDLRRRHRGLRARPRAPGGRRGGQPPGRPRSATRQQPVRARARRRAGRAAARPARRRRPGVLLQRRRRGQRGGAQDRPAHGWTPTRPAAGSSRRGRGAASTAARWARWR